MLCRAFSHQWCEPLLHILKCKRYDSVFDMAEVCIVLTIQVVCSNSILSGKDYITDLCIPLRWYGMK